MGFHISWLAVRGKPAEAVCAELKLVKTGKAQHLPEAPIAGCCLPTGWYLVFFNDPCASEVEAPALEQLSRNAEVVSCVVEEASMVSMASGYRNGVREWCFVHDSSNGLSDIEESGHFPDGYAAIRDSLLKKQAGTTKNVDYVFDVPAELGKQLTGFRHDECFGTPGEPAFVVLQRC